jgi:hypothetical protein
MPQIAALFGIAVDPKARPPRPLQVPRGDKGPHKRAGELNKSADGKPGADKPRRGPKPQGADTQKPAANAAASVPEAIEAEPVVAAIVDVVETPVIPTSDISVADAPVVSEAASTPEQAE